MTLAIPLTCWALSTAGIILLARWLWRDYVRASE